MDTNIFIVKAREILNWIDVNSDREFADWFRTLLYTTPGIMMWKFNPTSGASLGISNTFDLMKEIYIDDEIVRTVMELFSMSYGANDRYLFIPPLQIILWGQNILWEWKKDLVKSGRLEKAFAIVHMPDHWGALEVDFERRKISFGDSLSCSIPEVTINNVRNWIKCCGIDIGRWDCDTGHFAVPQQPPGSGSCAVNAINAVERSVNPRTAIWTHTKSAQHRLRLLKLVTGYSKVNIVTKHQASLLCMKISFFTT